MLVVFAGLPEAGTTDLATAAAGALGCPLRTSVADAETELRAGRHVVLDLADPPPARERDRLAILASEYAVPLRVIEVTGGGSAYRPYPGPRLYVDTSVAAEPIRAVLAYLG